MRDPVANKTHYPNGITLLDRQFEEVFTHKKGPGALPATVGESNDPVKAAIVPHAPYTLAGPAMAWAYKAIAEHASSDKLFIIVAQAQNSTESGVTTETFVTPYGEVRTDQHFIRDLVAKGSIAVNDAAHILESLIEIQLPFLQFIFKRHFEQLKIVPLLVNSETDIQSLSVDIKETLLEQDKEATLLFVTNFTSYGRDFQYVPFTDKIPEGIAANDKLVLDAIQNQDKEAFDAAIAETLMPLTGLAPLELFFRYFSKNNVHLEQYYLSGDINDNYLTTVSYASLLVK